VARLNLPVGGWRHLVMLHLVINLTTSVGDRWRAVATIGMALPWGTFPAWVWRFHGVRRREPPFVNFALLQPDATIPA
jgi:hypothetical protein